MYFAEHRFLGDTVDVHEEVANRHGSLTLSNGLVVTYGEINGLAGDYFGLDKPISSEPNAELMREMFRRWFDLLDFSPAGKLKAEAVMNEPRTMNDKALAVMRSGSENAATELAAVYKDTSLDITRLEEISKDDKWAIGSSFMQLFEANVDHFGVEARSTYDPGHTVALELAAKGELMTALTVNGFADHFLQDSFAAGHIRVPHREIAEIAKIINASSNAMHNEDGELGLWLESPSGERWKAFGDGRMPGKEISFKATSTNLDQCLKAVQQSIAEVHDAFHNKKIIQPSDFAAWRHAPILDKVSVNPENHGPLLKVENGNILARVNGVSSQKYEVIDGIGKWINFWVSNFSQVEDQVRLMVKKALGI
ncbi:hypothetical protein N0V84_010720 [Fusarium piperis]|uniref:Uncharacterized protein n=1 Tax=Fusarium piperis TaxID=1435070 RepID=A0A9W8TBR4_9HYPO|nr:hypothetical protein N0V84_010720 [Fusarium piperis]